MTILVEIISSLLRIIAVSNVSRGTQTIHTKQEKKYFFERGWGGLKKKISQKLGLSKNLGVFKIFFQLMQVNLRPTAVDPHSANDTAKQPFNTACVTANFILENKR